METVFTPLQSAIGGGLVGLSVVLLMLTLGRVFGATGIIAGALTSTSQKDRAWRIAIILGMLTAPLIYALFFQTLPEIQVPASTLMLLIGGILVGFGVTIGNGCTLGHGICGLALFSRRSVIAVLIFVVVNALTIYCIRHVFGA